MKKEIVPVKLKAYKSKSAVLDQLEFIHKTGIVFVDEKKAQQGFYDNISFGEVTNNIWKNYEPDVVDTTYEEIKPEQLSDGRENKES